MFGSCGSVLEVWILQRRSTAMRHVLILGGGTAGTILANKLSRTLKAKQWRITLVDKTGSHYYQPGFLFVPFGGYRIRDLVKPRTQFLPESVRYIQSAIDHIDPSHSPTRRRFSTTT
jgi:sulfide:quinone oxidoreductase